MPKGKTRDTGDSWQAQKSAMTRESLLNAAIDCFIELGYADTTTASVAQRAGVSRGAMLHHFPSKSSLVQAAVEHLHQRQLQLYRQNVRRIPASLDVLSRNRRGLRAYWKYLTSDLVTAYHELSVAGRTDPELAEVLEVTTQNFQEAWLAATAELFPEWAERGELYTLAMDLSQFLMEGMAMSNIARSRSKRIARMLDYLGDRLEEIFQQGDDSTAINRHAGR